jgi:hypothetical protein
MSIYNVNYEVSGQELLPPDRREDKFLKWLYSLLKPLQDLKDFVFTGYSDGSAASSYSGATTYTFGQQVKYQGRIYYRNEITDDYSAGITPTNTTYWTLLHNSFIGINERIRFNGQKIILEYALNKQFGTTFQQPPVLSDIWIENKSVVSDAFFIGVDDEDTATVAISDTDSDWFINDDITADDITAANFIIHVPVAVWTALAGTNSERDNIILTFVDKYKLFGYDATIETY